ncbi:hypothetical protein C809_01176 [Lachnospiraceae bacterium MD335]|jgi:hypothetical protein|nr:hypothetical protein C809_01176 [Lachnospiraceae bacterium MD335]
MFAVVLLCGNTLSVCAAETGNNTNNGSETENTNPASAEDKEHAIEMLNQYYSDLKVRYKLSKSKLKKMDAIYDNAVAYMKEAKLTVSELASYEKDAEGYLLEVARETTSSTPSDDDSSDDTINSASEAQREHVRGKLNRYYTDLKVRYSLSDEKIKKMDRVYNSAMAYMRNEGLTESELNAYESSIEEYLLEIAKENTTGTEKFLMLSNEVPISDAKYGEQAFVVLSLINLGKTDITDVVITPTVSNDRAKWPFDINQPYDAQMVQLIQASSNTADAYNKRMDIGWNFNVRKDVLTGCYPLTFHATYYQSGSLVETDIVTYINVRGANPSDTLIKDEDKQNSNPRIIVTGFTTNPDTIYAGSTFMLTVSVKNTSADTTVENVLFNLEATVEGNDTTATYAAFLPTSGSSSVYTSSIAPGATYDMSIEMEAKSDLAQKPYVLTVNMKYDTDEQINIADTAHVSVPIKQESKLDTSSAEIMPESIAVGEQSNVMFSVYNTGKTTLYNVKVSYKSDSVDEALTYLGNIAPGQTGSVDSMVTGVAPDTGEGIVKAIISYEDEAGNETQVEKDLNLSVYEMVFDDPGMEMGGEEFMGGEEEPKKGIPVVVIIIIVVVVIAAVIVVAAVIKKKKKAKQHKEDMDLLDEDKE